MVWLRIVVIVSSLSALRPALSTEVVHRGVDVDPVL